MKKMKLKEKMGGCIAKNGFGPNLITRLVFLTSLGKSYSQFLFPDYTKGLKKEFYSR